MRIEQYLTDAGHDPFQEWFDGLRGRQQAAVERRLAAVEDHDHFGDAKYLNGNLWEMRLHIGAGLRIYYTKIGQTVVLLLGGSEKRSQKRAIKTARSRIKDFNARTK